MRGQVKLRRTVRMVVATGHHTVRHHRAAEQFDRGKLVRGRQPGDAVCLGKLGHHTAAGAVWRLTQPAAELQPTLGQELEQLWNRVGAVLRIEQRVGHGCGMLEVGCLAQQGLQRMAGRQ